MSLDTQSADLVLLSQNLAKSRRVTQRMEGILAGFDDRLARLERSVVGVYKSMGEGRKVSINIDAALAAIDDILDQQAMVDRQTEILSKGPSAKDIKPYTDALDQLVQALQASGLDSETRNGINIKLQKGSTQLRSIFLTYAKDLSSQPLPLSLLQSARTSPPSPPNLSKLVALLSYTRSLPLSPPPPEKDLQRSWAEIRGSYIARSLENYAGPQWLDPAQSNIGQPSEKTKLADWVETLIVLVRAEYALPINCGMFPNQAQAWIYSHVLPPSLALFMRFGTAVNTVLKKNPTGRIAVALEACEGLVKVQSLFEEWVRSKGQRKENELIDVLHGIRAVCLTAAGEMIEEVKKYGAKTPTPAEGSSAGVAEICVQTMTFMKALCTYRSTVETFLTVLGDGNWLYGGTSSRSMTVVASSASTLLEKYLFDLLHALLTALDARSRSPAMRARSGLASIFLLNNFSFLRRDILSSAPGDIIDDTHQDELNRRMRIAKAGYLDLWAPVVAPLLDMGKETSGMKLDIAGVRGGGEKRDVKERLGKFNDALEEVEALHRVAPLDKGERELKDKLKEEVTKMVVPSYRAFIQRHAHGDFSKNPAKYIKYEPDQLAARFDQILS